MRSKLYLLLFFACYSISVSAYTSPGTNLKLTLNDLVALSGGEVTFAGDFYNVNASITISATDTLSITTDATVKFAALTTLTISGVIIIDPPTGVKFTAQNIASAYNGINLIFSNASFFKKLTFEYAVAFKLTDSSPRIDSCIFQYNNNSTVTTFGSSAMPLFRASPVITNCQFLNNLRGAIGAGLNVNNAPKISGCLFKGNNTATSSSLPQINLSSSGTDTVKIIGNQFLEASIYSGAIAFAATAELRAVISSNTIRKNRYGITFNGGSSIHALISYNIIDSNRIQNDPLIGGSGIAFSGGTSTSHQDVIVTGNIIRWNLWGITVGPTTTGGGAKPNLGNLTNTDTTDDGKNQFINNNNNSATPQIDLYNNNVDDIFAQGNYWGTPDPVTVEAKIFHKTDDPALGLVNYTLFTPFLTVPVELESFAATKHLRFVALNWRTATEVNSDHFEIEKSDDGSNFNYIGSVQASGNSTTVKHYDFDDVSLCSGNKRFYRLKLYDKDGRFKYSKVVFLNLQPDKQEFVELYPTVISGPDVFTVKIVSNKSQSVFIEFFDAEGKLISRISKSLISGLNEFSLSPNTAIPKGLILIKFSGEDFSEIKQVLKQ